MVQAQLKAKVNYKPKSSVEGFYSGGAVTLSTDGRLACACQDDIKVLLPMCTLDNHVCFRSIGDRFNSLHFVTGLEHQHRGSNQDTDWGMWPADAPVHIQQ